MSPPLPATPTKASVTPPRMTARISPPPAPTYSGAQPVQPLGGLLRSVLARLLHRRSSPPNPNNPPSNRSSSSLPISASRALGGLAVVLALTVGLLFLLPGGPAWAQQDAETIEYAEKGDGSGGDVHGGGPRGDRGQVVAGGGQRSNATL